MSVTSSKMYIKMIQNTFRRYISHSRIYYNKLNTLEEVNERILSLGDYKDKVIYNSYIATKFKWQVEKQRKRDYENQSKKLEMLSTIPVSLKYLVDNADIKLNEENLEEIKDSTLEKKVNIPYAEGSNLLTKVSEEGKLDAKEIKKSVEEDIKQRYNMKYNSETNWMLDYENYDDVDLSNKSFYGTEDPQSIISNVPCGGCGAYLHCRDSSLPGYVPSEIYNNYNLRDGMELKSLICQRCHFLKNYNLALQLRVSSEDYPKVLSTIRNHKNALVVLIVDLLDFPSSIWRGMTELIGYNRPIIVVGNKVDLLQVDDKNFLSRVEDELMMSVKECGFATSNIKGVSLISAKTGFGIEELINKLHSTWMYNGKCHLIENDFDKKFSFFVQVTSS